jgi:hypothetical protein
VLEEVTLGVGRSEHALATVPLALGHQVEAVDQTQTQGKRHGGQGQRS